MLLGGLVDDPEMTEHLGGIEDAARIAERQARYQMRGSGAFKIVAENGEDAGWVARDAGHRRYVHAFPAVAKVPSNALCRSLGFELLGEHDFEYPPGHFIRCHDWRLDLRAGAPG